MLASVVVACKRQLSGRGKPAFRWVVLEKDDTESASLWLREFKRKLSIPMMKLLISYLSLAIIMSILCGGCAAPLLAGASNGATAPTASTAVTDVISNPSALDYTTDSTKIPFLTPAALTSGNRWTEAYVTQEQCYFKTADPLFFVPDELQQPSWDFAGRLDATNHFEALEYRNILTLGLTGGKTQLNTWPVELVSFSDMPAVFLQQRLVMLTQAKLSADDQHYLAEDFIERSQRIQQVVTRLEAEYDPKLSCSAHAS